MKITVSFLFYCPSTAVSASCTPQAAWRPFPSLLYTRCYSFVELSDAMNCCVHSLHFFTTLFQIHPRPRLLSCDAHLYKEKPLLVRYCRDPTIPFSPKGKLDTSPSNRCLQSRVSSCTPTSLSAGSFRSDGVSSRCLQGPDRLSAAQGEEKQKPVVIWKRKRK